MLHIYWFILGMGCAVCSFAQTDLIRSEKEKQQLVEELAELKKNPYHLYRLKKRADTLTQHILEKEQYLNQLKNLFDSLADEQDKQVLVLDSLKKVHLYWRKKTGWMNSYYYSIQIGAFKSHLIDRFANLHPFFRVESIDGGLKRYLIGYFNSYGEAQKFNRFLKKNGVSCYVISFLKQ